MNTLVFEPELPVVEHLLRGVAKAGVDALIVQDPAVALLARAICPQLELHASTQMTLSSAEGARFATGLGFTRMVVPRELSVAEIRRLASQTDIELEVFIHGALCMSWSGQCLTSEAWGGRSANRGQCAQSCRLPYDLVEGRFPKHRGLYLGRVHALSGKDVLVVPDDRPWTGALGLGDERPEAPAGSVSAPLTGEPDPADVDPRPGMGVVFDAGAPEDKHEPGGPIFRVEREGDAWVLGAYQELLAGRLSPSEAVKRAAVHEQFGVTRGTMQVLKHPAANAR
nr:U32 family peptidase [Corallococcus exiguus]